LQYHIVNKIITENVFKHAPTLKNYVQSVHATSGHYLWESFWNASWLREKKVTGIYKVVIKGKWLLRESWLLYNLNFKLICSILWNPEYNQLSWMVIYL